MAGTIHAGLQPHAQTATLRMKACSGIFWVRQNPVPMTHDIWVTLTTDEMSQDWQAKRAEHNEYVYDSGCLTCHQELESVTKNQEEHNNYFNDVIDSQCVDCHEEIGHSNLNKYLLETKYRYGE